MSRQTLGKAAWNCVGAVSELKWKPGFSGSKNWSRPNVHVPGLLAAHSCVGKNWMLPPSFQLCEPELIDSVSCASVNVVIVPVRHGQRHWLLPQIALGKRYCTVPMYWPAPSDAGIVTGFLSTSAGV